MTGATAAAPERQRGVDAEPVLDGRGPGEALPDQGRRPDPPHGRERSRPSTASTSTLYPGETLGLVGESGCGKSTTGRAILNLQPATGGSVKFNGAELTTLNRRRAMRPLRREMQIVFQDPYASLEPAAAGQRHRRRAADRSTGRDEGGSCADRVEELLQLVGLNPEHGNRYPHEFSGGQRQRIGIARALALNPKCSSWTSRCPRWTSRSRPASSTCSRTCSDQLGLSYLFIAHDLSVVRHISDRVAVMYLGKIVEIGDDRRPLRAAGAPVHAGAAVRDPDARPAAGAPAQADRARPATCRARPTRRPAAGSAPGARSSPTS